MTVVSSPYPTGTPAWVGLTTTDRDGAMRFYRSLFGWEYAAGGPGHECYTQALLRGLPVAGIWNAPPTADRRAHSPTAWTTYLAADDCDAVCEKARAAGAQVIMEPTAVTGAGRVAMLADPTGAVVGLWQAQRHIGGHVVNEPDSLCWNELTTRDPARAIEFLRQVFGYELEHVPPPADAPEFYYTALRLAGRGVGGVLGMTADWPADIQPHWMPYFAVAEADDTAAMVKELGGDVTHGPVDSAYGRIAGVRDPYGAVFSVLQMTGDATATS